MKFWRSLLAGTYLPGFTMHQAFFMFQKTHYQELQNLYLEFSFEVAIFTGTSQLNFLCV